MSEFYGGMPGKDFIISKTFDSLDELKNPASAKHKDIVIGDYVIIYKPEDENNGELWQCFLAPDNPLYKSNYQEVIKINDNMGYGLVGNLSGPRGFTPTIGADGNWIIGGQNTGKPSRGEKGEKGDTGEIETLDETIKTSIDGLIQGKDGHIAKVDQIPSNLLPKNAVNQDGIVPAPTSSKGNALWATDSAGNPTWHNDLDYQNKAQVETIVQKAISESGHASFKKVDKVPSAQEAEDNILYLVYNAATQHYDIYAKVENQVLLIDDTTVDLKNYATLQNLANKVDKAPGKQLSTEDYSTAEKNKLAGIESGAQVNKIETVKLNGTALVPDGSKAVNIEAYNEDNKPEVGGRNLFIWAKSVSGYLADDNSGDIVFGDIHNEHTSDYIEILEDDTDFTCQIWETSTDNDPTYGAFITWQFFLDKTSESKCSEKKWLFGGGLGYKHQIAYIKDIPPEAKYIRVCARFYNDGKMKFERGEIPTDWSPAPEDLEAKIDNLQIGGRNLLLGTKDFSGNWENKWAAAIESEKYMGLTVASRDVAWNNIHQEVTVPAGTYTMSAYVRTDEGVEGAEFAIGFGGDAKYIIATPQWTRYSTTAQREAGTYDAIVNPAKNKKIYFCGLKLERGNKSTDWSSAPEDLETTAENFEGVLPVNKGGTGNILIYPVNDVLSLSDFRSQIGQSDDSAFIMPASHAVNSDPWINWSPGIKFGIGNVHGYFDVCHTYPYVIVGGGLDGSICWHEALAFKSDVSATQLALASLYESRSVSTVSADTPIESPSIDGELSDLDQNMVKVYADLCLNPDSGKSVSDVPELLRSYVSAIVEETLAKRKEEEERYRAEMEKRAEEARLKAEQNYKEKQEGAEINNE